MQLDVTTGPPVTRGALALVPLLRPALAAPAAAPPGYLAGPDAFRAGAVRVAERGDGAVVPELEVRVVGPTPVLLIEGESILGAQQNRVLNVSVVLAADAADLVPVSCVEAGRWGRAQTARRSTRHSPSALRRVKTRSVAEAVRRSGDRRSDQGAVWDEVDGLLEAHQAASASAALEDVYASVAPRLDEALVGIDPVADQVGVVALTAGRVVALDLFDDPATLRTYWDQLVSGYALDALVAPPGATDADALVAAVERFLAAVAGAAVDRAPGVGEGTDLVLDGEGVVGLGVEWRDHLRHLAAFPR
ncbi:MAG: DUF6569 family protein [Acidimicrobiales bacterium]